VDCGAGVAPARRRDRAGAPLGSSLEASA
jgi:hypothetical protein